MKRSILIFCLLSCCAAAVQAQYVPSPENMRRRTEFEGFRLGIFIHWGIYSLYGQGEWYLISGLNRDEYAKAADAFYPHRFDAREWVEAFKNAGAGYVNFTSRNHDGFSMWGSEASDYNIVEATPFGRDVVRELSEACEEGGLRLHLYYSLLDWGRDDYPAGWTGKAAGGSSDSDYDSYFEFMKRQLHELLTRYGEVGGLWFDGYWDHKESDFDWRISELYAYAHSLRPELLIGNNHHISPLEGEDFQMFERDLPGENKAGFSKGQEVSRLPLEMCQTMNGMWGYKVSDTDYKSADRLIELLVRAAGKGCNLLLNIGPQPNGELPAAALERLQAIGEWMRTHGPSICGTLRGEAEGPWGVSTRTQERTYLHILDRTASEVFIQLPKRPKSVAAMDGRPFGWRYDKRRHTLTLTLPDHADDVDLVAVIEE